MDSADISCSLRRRFEQNQEDCTFTVLAILPTATENILEAIPVEQILSELQQHKAERLARSVRDSEIASSVAPSVTDDDGKSLASGRSEGYVHASQTSDGTGEERRKEKRSKAQLWNEMKISCMLRQLGPISGRNADRNSHFEILHIALHPLAADASYADTTQPPRPTALSGLRGVTGRTAIPGDEDQSGEQRR